MCRRRRPGPSTIRHRLSDGVALIPLALTPQARLAAENLFLRKQLALYQERGVKPSGPDAGTRAVLVPLSGLVDWRSVLTVVKPDTLIRGTVRAGACSGGASRDQDGHQSRRRAASHRADEAGESHLG